nr:MAG TPA_asm: hypothetical protein [Caudoviricetes sp.]
MRCGEHYRSHSVNGSCNVGCLTTHRKMIDIDHAYEIRVITIYE